MIADYKCNITLTHTFRFTPETSGYYLMSELDEALCDVFEELNGEALGVNDIVGINKITHCDESCLVEFSATIDVKVTATEADNELIEIKDRLDELFDDCEIEVNKFEHDGYI